MHGDGNSLDASQSAEACMLYRLLMGQEATVLGFEMRGCIIEMDLSCMATLLLITL